MQTGQVALPYGYGYEGMYYGYPGAVAEGPPAAYMDSPEMPPEEHYEETEPTPRQFQGRAIEADVDVENLDDDETWREGPWVPPSPEDAAEDARALIFQNGAAPLCQCGGGSSLDALGVGPSLYFRFVRSFLVFFVVASLLASPTIILATEGNRIPEDQIDAVGFATTTLGNLGVRGSGGDGGTFNASACFSRQREVWEEENGGPASGSEEIQARDTEVYRTCNASKEAEAGDSTKLLVDFYVDIVDASPSRVDGEVVAWIVSLSDLSVVLAFLVLLRYLSSQIKHVNEIVGDSAITAVDYAVMVENLPRDVKKEEVVEHFSALYDLRATDWTFEGYMYGFCSRKDWRRRRFLHPSAVERLNREEAEEAAREGRRMRRVSNGLGGVKVHPTLDVTNTSDPMYLRKWVAEVSLVYPNGDLLQRFASLRGLFEKLRAARAEVKRRSVGSPFADEDLLARAEKRRLDIEKRVKEVNMKHAQDAFEEVIGAFVVFQNEESRRRCLEDYAESHNPCGRYWQAAPLRFRGTHALRVSPAPEPIQVMWESIEVAPMERCCRQALVSLVMIVLLLVSFVAIFLTQRAQSQFSALVPDFAVCARDLPAVYYGSSSSVPQSAKLVRRTPLDADSGLEQAISSGKTPREAGFSDDDLGNAVGDVCGSGFFVAFAHDTQDLTAAAIDPPQWYPEAVYSFVDADNSLLQLAPLTGAPNGTLLESDSQCFDPCVSTTSSKSCILEPSLAASSPSVAGSRTPKTDKTFTPSSITACYCVDTLQRAVEELGVFAAAEKLSKEDGDVCGAFAESYSVAQSLLVVASLAVVIVNAGLKFALRAVTKFERHVSRGNEESAIALKVLGASFVNTALISLLVNAQLFSSAAPSWLASLNGEFRDFRSPGWYSTVGVSIALIMLINTVAPPLSGVLLAICSTPCRGCRAAQSRTQAEMDALYRPPEMDLATQWPILLNTVLVTLFFSAGIPVLLPLAAGAMLVTYLIERWAALRLYAAPPLTTDALAKQSLRLLLLAVPLNLAIAIWMLGADNTLHGPEVTVGADNLGPPVQISTANADVFFSTLGESILWGYGSWITAMSGSEPQGGFLGRARKLFLVPLFVFLAITLLIFFLYIVVSRALLQVLRRCISILSCGSLCTAAAASEDARTTLRLLPPFTGRYEVRLPLGTRHYVSEAEYDDGWRIRKDRERGKGAEKKVKVFTEDDFDDPVRPHAAGDSMLTYEVISDYSIASYDILAHPSYREAAKALQAGQNQLDMARVMAAERYRRAQEEDQRRKQVAVNATAHEAREEEEKRNERGALLNLARAKSARVLPDMGGKRSEEDKEDPDSRDEEEQDDVRQPAKT